MSVLANNTTESLRQIFRDVRERYAELRDRADDPQPDDGAPLVMVLAALGMTFNHFEHDVRGVPALARVAELESRIIPDEELARLGRRVTQIGQNIDAEDARLVTEITARE